MHTVYFSSEPTSLHINKSFVAGQTAPGAYSQFIAGPLVHWEVHSNDLEILCLFIELDC